ncbi:hypothetical protein ACHAXN_010393 [Cyclotella atomus]
MSFAKPLQMAALRQSATQTFGRAAPQRSATSKSINSTRATLFYQLSNLSLIQTRDYSRTSPLQVLGWMRDKWEASEKTKQAAKLVDQIALMANTPVWTIKMFKDEIDETLSSWKTKVPGMGGTSQIQAAKDTQKAVTQLVAQLGSNATAQDIASMDRKEKLKLAIACEMTMDEVNLILQQFRQMELMHRILRYRKENGIQLPSDSDGLKMAMQQDGMKVLSNAEKREMQKIVAKSQQSKA